MAWFCLWTDILDCPKLAKIDDETLGGWILILAATKRFDRDGVVPPFDRLAHWCRRPEMKLRAWVSKLEDVGLLEEVDDNVVVHDWNDWQHLPSGPKPTGKAMSGAERSRAYRNRKKSARHESVTPIVTNVTVPPLILPPSTGQDIRVQDNHVTSRHVRDDSRHATEQTASRDEPRDANSHTHTFFVSTCEECKKDACIKLARERWGASNGDAVIGDLLKTFPSDVVMASMDAVFDRFAGRLEVAYLRKCCEGKYRALQGLNGKA